MENGEHRSPLVKFQRRDENNEKKEKKKITAQNKTTLTRAHNCH